MERQKPEIEPIRFKFGPNGKIVRSLFLTSMYLDEEEPEIYKFKTLAERNDAIREKLREELQELIAVESKSDMLDEAADFMTAAETFHEQVEANQQDSEIFGDFQSLIRNRGLNMHEIEIRRQQRDAQFGPLIFNQKVMSVLINADNPRRQYYLDNPDRFPRTEVS